jgi:MFS family permease
VSVGAVSCFSAGIFLDRTNKYLFALRFVTLGTCISLVSAIFLSMTGNTGAIAVFGVMAGCTMVPIVPVAFAFAGEVTYPLAPAMVIGLMTTVSNLTLFVIQFLYAYLLKDGKKEGSYITFGIMALEAFIAFFFTFFLKEDLRRLNSVSDIASMRANSRTGSVLDDDLPSNIKKP